MINPKKSVISCLYKPPKMDVFDLSLSRERKLVFLFGDCNINILNYNDHQPPNDFLDSVVSFSFIPYVSYRTRITGHSKTLIGNIFSNFISHKIISGNITATIPDHLLKILFVPDILSNPSTQKSNFYERDWSKCKQENSILDYLDKD